MSSKTWRNIGSPVEPIKANVGGEAIPVVPIAAVLKYILPLIPTPPLTLKAPEVTDVDCVEEEITTSELKLPVYPYTDHLNVVEPRS